MHFIQTITKLSMIPLVAVTLFGSTTFAADLGIKAGDNQGAATFHEIIKPNQTINRYVELVNSAQQETTGSLIAKDGLQSTDGSYTFISTDEPNTGAGNWYTVAKPEIQIPGGNVARDDFSITVPNNTVPGEYGSSLAIVEKNNEQVSGNIRIVNRNGIRNLVVVPGNSPSDLKLGNEVTNVVFVTSADTKKVSAANFELKNIGNLFSKSEITYDVQGPKDFSQLDRLTTDIGPTDKTISINTKLTPQNWINGGYTLTLNVKNTPVNRKLTSGDYVYAVRVQKMVFTFDMIDGVVNNLKIAENTKRAQDWDTGWYRQEYIWALAAILMIASLGGGYWYWKKVKKSKINTKTTQYAPQSISKKTII